jgi:hypothetical protein
MKRALRIDAPEGTDPSLAKELQLSSLAALTVTRPLLYFEERSDGTWRITHTDILFPDFTKVERFVFEGVPDNPQYHMKNLKMRIEGTVHEWEIASALTVLTKPGERFMRFNKNGSKWTLTMSRDLLEGISKLTSFTMVRED